MQDLLAVSGAADQGPGRWIASSRSEVGRALLLDATLPNASRALEHRLQRIHHEADARQVGVDGAAGADDRIGELQVERIPRRGVERGPLRLAALRLVEAVLSIDLD